MLYKKPSDLPPQVKNLLSEHAQEVYIKAFNSALEEYRDPEKYHETLEEVAHEEAWSAVKKEFHKNEHGKWVRSHT